MAEFTFAKSTAIKFPVHVKMYSLLLNKLDGVYTPPRFSELVRQPELRQIGSNTGPNSDLFVTAELWANSQSLGDAVRTSYKSLRHGRVWDEWLELPIGIDQLLEGTQLAITLWDWSATAPPSKYGFARPFGGTTITLFDDQDILRQGSQQCKVHRGREADGHDFTETPAFSQSRKGPSNTKNVQIDQAPLPEELELQRLEDRLKKLEAGDINKVAWLDVMVQDAIEKKRHQVRLLKSVRTKAQHIRSKADAGIEGRSGPTEGNHAGEDSYTLYIELPRFDFPIVFTDYEYEPTPVSFFTSPSAQANAVVLKPPPEVQLGPGINSMGDDDVQNDDHDYPLIRIYDPEVGARENPAETKHRRLIRCQRSGLLDKDLKPNAKIRDELNAILGYGPTHELSVGEKDIVWKYRHHLTRDKRALTKFVKSVSWRDEAEASQAVQLLPKWTEIDIDDALEILGPTFKHPGVRAYAVNRLQKAKDDELQLYLLQLVQALKFEEQASEASPDTAEEWSLAKFLIKRATESMRLGNFLHWYLMVECDDQSPETDGRYRKLYAKVEYDFMFALSQMPEGIARRQVLLRQGEMIAVLSRISKEIRFSREDRPRRIARLKGFLADPKNELLEFDPPLPLPLDPSVLLTGIVPEESNVFKSSLFPLLLTFRTTTGSKYPLIFKTGDDLRQDQLVIQIITLMDQLLRKENLDLRLSPYAILATSTSAGAVQFIPSMSLAAATAKYRGSILAYLRANNPDPRADLGVRKDTMDSYVKSCAGYCVITYLLGVGDRHLDNLLLAPDGHFFHADFGYILGRDPKPFAPQMKLCREMVEGMGGSTSRHYRDFKSFCFTAYITLRKSSNLILNLFALMVDANITDIRLLNRESGVALPPPTTSEVAGAGGANGRDYDTGNLPRPNYGASAVVEKVRERFHLEMNEEEAMRHFETLIADSVGAIFPVVIDTLHNMMQGLRA